MRAVRQHGVNLISPMPRGSKCQVYAIRRPGGLFVLPLTMGQLDELPRGHRHSENVPRLLGESLGPRKRDNLPVRMPGSIASLAGALRQPLHVGSIHIHLVDLLRAGPAGSEDDLTACLRINLRLSRSE